MIDVNHLILLDWSAMIFVQWVFISCLKYIFMDVSEIEIIVRKNMFEKGSVCLYFRLKFASAVNDLETVPE